MTMSHDELSQLWHSWSLRDSLANIAPPAVLYAIQNILVQASYHHNINSMIFNLVCNKMSDCSISTIVNLSLYLCS